MIPYKGAVENVIDGISDGLKSSMSYMNCKSIEQLWATETFTVLSNSSYLERLPKKWSVMNSINYFEIDYDSNHLFLVGH